MRCAPNVVVCPVSRSRSPTCSRHPLANAGTRIKRSEDMMGVSIFACGEDGEVFHTYSAFARGIENLMGTFMWLDLTPKGRHQFDDGRSRLSEDGLRDVLVDDRNLRHARTG